MQTSKANSNQIIEYLSSGFQSADNDKDESVEKEESKLLKQSQSNFTFYNQRNYQSDQVTSLAISQAMRALQEKVINQEDQILQLQQKQKYTLHEHEIKIEKQRKKFMKEYNEESKKRNEIKNRENLIQNEIEKKKEIQNSIKKLKQELEIKINQIQQEIILQESVHDKQKSE